MHWSRERPYGPQDGQGIIFHSFVQRVRSVPDGLKGATIFSRSWGIERRRFRRWSCMMLPIVPVELTTDKAESIAGGRAVHPERHRAVSSDGMRTVIRTDS